MARERKREEWLQDIQARQRNTVFPDTVNNEARFWRNLIEGKQRLTAVQKIGVALLGLGAGLVVFMTLGILDPHGTGFTREKLLSGAIRWLIAILILVFFLAIFRLSQRSNRKQ